MSSDVGFSTRASQCSTALPSGAFSISDFWTWVNQPTQQRKIPLIALQQGWDNLSRAAPKNSGSLEDLETTDAFPAASQEAGEPGTPRPDLCLGSLISAPGCVQGPRGWNTLPVSPDLQGFNSSRTLV